MTLRCDGARAADPDLDGAGRNAVLAGDEHADLVGPRFHALRVGADEVALHDGAGAALPQLDAHGVVGDRVAGTRAVPADHRALGRLLHGDPGFAEGDPGIAVTVLVQAERVAFDASAVTGHRDRDSGAGGTLAGHRVAGAVFGAADLRAGRVLADPDAGPAVEQRRPVRGEPDQVALDEQAADGAGRLDTDVVVGDDVAGAVGRAADPRAIGSGQQLDPDPRAAAGPRFCRLRARPIVLPSTVAAALSTTSAVVLALITLRSASVRPPICTGPEA